MKKLTLAQRKEEENKLFSNDFIGSISKQRMYRSTSIIVNKKIIKFGILNGKIYIENILFLEMVKNWIINYFSQMLNRMIGFRYI